MLNQQTGGALTRPLLSFFFSIVIAGLIVAPNIPYHIPLPMMHRFAWCFAVVFSGLFGFLFYQTKAPFTLRVLSWYLFVCCFFSQSPYLSFNAYILVVATLWLFLVLQLLDFVILLKVLEAAFWLEVVLVVFQLTGYDRLLNFDRPGESLFLGTVMQYMRFASVLGVMAPFLILRDWRYIFPIVGLCILSQSSTFAMSLIMGGGTYLFLLLKSGRNKIRVIVYGILAVLSYAVYDYGSFEGAIDPANGGRLYSWGIIFTTWFTDTAQASPPPFTGPFVWQWFLIGHGLDTFLTLFPIYKHDPNPFPQAHNCWLQFLWEIGLVGFLLVAGYVSNLFLRLYKRRAYDAIAGGVCLCTNMFFAFPTRMTQTVLLLVAYCAMCEAYLAGRLTLSRRT